MEDGGVIGFVLIGLALYFLPTLIVNIRNHPNGTAIAVLNLLLGWTFLGWVVALVWSASNIAPPSASEAQAHKAKQERDSLGKWFLEKPKIQAEQSKEKICPDCAETIKAAANVCHYCGYRFET